MMGTINFVHPAFRPRVVSDKPSADGYDTANLVALENYMPPKGFLIASYIRPPVNIYLTFPCNIDIARIVFNGTVGSHKSTCFDIFSYTTSRTAESCLQRWENHPALVASDFNSYVFSPVGRVWQESPDYLADVVCFSNPCFRPRMPFSELSPMPSKLFNQTTKEVQFVKALSSVSHLIVRVTKTSNGGVPGLRWIEVWGQPSSSSSPEDINRVLYAYNHVMGDRKHRPSAHSVIHPAHSVQHPVKPVEVPPEFVDPLTCAIMAQPMLLPSRKSIDMSTLEKYDNMEAQYGRVPNDPFTTVPYTPNSKPIPNAALKVRIDHFLMTNSGEEITAAHRTVGRSVDMLAQKRTGQSVVQTSILLDDPAQPPSQRAASIRLQPPRPREPPRALHPRPVVPVPIPRCSATNVIPKPASCVDGSLDLVLAGRHSFGDEQTSPSAPLNSPVSSLSSSLNSAFRSVSSPSSCAPHSSSSSLNCTISSSSLPLSGAIHSTCLQNGPINTSSQLNSSTSSCTIDLRTNPTLVTPGGSVQKRASSDAKKTSPRVAKRTKRQSSSIGVKSSIIDLTCDSDPEESPSYPSNITYRTSSSVIRTNPAAVHARNLTRSLDNAIDQTLSNLPSFQGSPTRLAHNDTEWKTTKLECMYCTLKREMGMMYRLACGDVTCRDCLSSRRRTGQILCDQCKQTTRTKDITKLHA